MSSDVTIQADADYIGEAPIWTPGHESQWLQIQDQPNKYAGTMIYGDSGFVITQRHLMKWMMDTEPVHTGEWQAMNTKGSKAHATWEVLDATLLLSIPMTRADLILTTDPDLPWAEEHFLERISGQPYNPAPSHERWPHRVRGNGDHISQGVFSHTYPERFWPKRAGTNWVFTDVDEGAIPGIRFNYGDLSDLISLLVRNPYTRQAYLPIWFPEDLAAAAKGERVPCTLGYHFMVRGNELSCRYYMRSCDILRHYRNDVYMAGRLMQHICEEVNDHATKIADQHGIPPLRTIVPGQLRMNISSLHAFVGDKAKLEAVIRGE